MAFNVTFEPEQEAPVTEDVALALTGTTVTTTESVDVIEQPVVGLVAVAKYAVVVVGLTVAGLPVAPPVHDQFRVLVTLVPTTPPNNTLGRVL